MMQALHFSEVGGACVAGEVEAQAAAEGDVVVDMAYAALNAIDAQIWRGLGGLAPPLPHVPGVEGAGWLDGKPVMIFGHGLGVTRAGTAAERVSVNPAALYPVHDGVDLAAAAVCGATGATAMRLFELVEASPGDLVVLYGAGGSIGTMLTSLLHSAGVDVIGQIRDPARAAAVEAAGAVPLVAADGDALVVQLAGRTPVAVVDPLGGAWTQAAVDILPPGGRIVTFGALAGPMTLDTLTFYRKGLTLRGYSGLSEPAAHARCVGEALAALADKRLLVEPLLRKYSLERAGDAFASLVAGEPGRILVELPAAG